jgi:hypothetical protein
MKTTSFLTLLAFFVFTLSGPINAFAADSLQFDQPTAQKLDGDLNFYKKSIEECTAKGTNLKQQSELQDKTIEVLKDKGIKLQIDLTKEMKATQDYKDLYTKADDARLKAIENTPSRATWFGIGSATTLVLGIILAVLLGR